MTKYTLHFKYQAVLHYLHIRSQQRTADHYGILPCAEATEANTKPAAATIKEVI